MRWVMGWTYDGEVELLFMMLCMNLVGSGLGWVVSEAWEANVDNIEDKAARETRDGGLRLMSAAKTAATQACIQQLYTNYMMHIVEQRYSSSGARSPADQGTQKHAEGSEREGERGCGILNVSLNVAKEI